MEELFKKYLAGTCTSDEYSKVLDFISHSANNHVLDEFLRKYWTGFQAENPTLRNTELLDRIHHQIALTENKSIQKSLRIYKVSLKIAAVFIFGILLVAGWLYRSLNQSSDAGFIQEISTPLASRTSFDLPDGSKVWLNAGSTITFPAKFTRKSRLVKLVGEAYFDVQKDKIPFIVETSKFSVNVLGTAFNVMAYADETAWVTLEHGKVELDHNGETLGYLDPGQQAQIEGADVPVKIENVETSIFTSWKENRLFFQSEPLGILSRRLERWYNLKIIIQDKSLIGLKVTGKIEMESFSEVLDLLELTLPIEYEFNKNERKLTIYKKK